jgi:3-deoxy-7-phosphoheptulonate synthase
MRHIQRLAGDSLMLIVMERDCSAEQIQTVVQKVERMGFKAHPIPGEVRTAIAITGNREPIEPAEFESLPGVLQALRVTRPYKLVSRELKPNDSIVRIGMVRVGGPGFVVIAGPCAVETERQTIDTALAVKAGGAHMMRGGAFKPRTSPYSFQGLGLEGLKILAKARKETGLPVVTEAVDDESIALVEEYADVIQIGARNMQNFQLLKRAGRCARPVFLKRGMSATLDELLMSAEYVMSEGNHNVILCERGVRTFVDHARNTLDLSVIPAVKKRSHLPIFVDPSHGTGIRDKVAPLARASLAVGADGVMLEVHPDPDRALSDGAQALLPPMFGELMRDLERMAPLVGRTLEQPER